MTTTASVIRVEKQDKENHLSHAKILQHVVVVFSVHIQSYMYSMWYILKLNFIVIYLFYVLTLYIKHYYCIFKLWIRLAPQGAIFEKLKKVSKFLIILILPCRVVTYKTGKSLADSWKAAFFELSAKENSVRYHF